MRSDPRSRQLLALTAITGMVIIAGCASPTDAGSVSSFRATLSGALNKSVVGTAAASGDTTGRLFSFPGPPGVAATLIGLQSADHRDIVSFYIPGATLKAGTYTVRALNGAGSGPAIGAAFIHDQADGSLQLYQGGAGTVTITFDAAGATHGEFAFQAGGYDVIPTGPLNTPLTPLGHVDAALSMSGSFVAVKAP